MSHFTKCELKMTNLTAIKRALDDLGYAYTTAEQNQAVSVRGWRGQTMEGAISIDMGKYDIGVVTAGDGTYDIAADWWGVETTKGISEKEFRDRLSQRYAYYNVLEACEQKGYSLEEEVNEADGSIQLVVRKWVTD